jgi:hypothetical protein
MNAQVRLVFRKTVEKPTSPEGLQKMYENFLSFTTITTSKKLHLVHCTMPTVMEDMGWVILLTHLSGPI